MKQIAILLTLFSMLYLSAEEKSDSFIIVLIDAPNFDYCSGDNFFESLRQRSERTKAVFGHAWVFLKGMIEGKETIIECGFSGERGAELGYFEGIDFLIRCKEPNPARFLQKNLKDGFLEQGAGGHEPTIAAKIAISDEQFIQVMRFIKNYSYPQYNLASRQCVTYVSDILKILGYSLNTWTKIEIPSRLVINGKKYRMWEDSKYGNFCFQSPDLLQHEVEQLIASGKAEDAYTEYFTLKELYSSYPKFQKPPLHEYRCMQITAGR